MVMEYQPRGTLTKHRQRWQEQTKRVTVTMPLSHYETITNALNDGQSTSDFVRRATTLYTAVRNSYEH